MEEWHICKFCHREYNISNQIPHEIKCPKNNRNRGHSESKKNKIIKLGNIQDNNLNSNRINNRNIKSCDRNNNNIPSIAQNNYNIINNNNINKIKYFELFPNPNIQTIISSNNNKLYDQNKGISHQENLNVVMNKKTLVLDIDETLVHSSWNLLIIEIVI